MSWHFSQALVAASSVDTSSDGGASAPSNTTTMPAAFSSHGRTTDASRRSRSGMTFAPLTDAHGEALLTWCLAASRARTSAPPAKAQASVDHDPGCGPRWRGLSVRFDHATSGWRTARCLYAEALDWSSLTLPRWGSLHDGELWERTTQAPRTSATGSGCWPTPTADACIGVAPTPAMAERFRRKGSSGSFVEAMAAKMWPTPKASAAGPDFAAMKRGKSISLQTAVMLPTPTVQDATNNGGKRQYQQNSLPLNAIAGGALNPTWVEWLMGWPLGWTDCGASATDRFREWCSAHGRNFND
jgi:hypothetical protein